MIQKSIHKCKPYIFQGSEFHASDGWFEKFKRRHGRLLIADESADANIEKAEDFIVNGLPRLIEGYAAEDIYNADETRIVFKCLPDKTYGLATRNATAERKVKIDLQ
jgi:hypothetical protein